jgi:hypothetical protein
LLLEQGPEAVGGQVEVAHRDGVTRALDELDGHPAQVGRRPVTHRARTEPSLCFPRNRYTGTSIDCSSTSVSPRAGLRAVLGSFIPVDDASRENMLMFVALHTAALVDPSLSRPEAREVPDALHLAVRARLTGARLRAGVDADLEAAVLVGLVPSLAQGVLDGTFTAERAFLVLDYALDRAVA